MKKILLLTLLCVPFTSFAWVKPVLTSTCAEYTITLVPEANQIIEFSNDNFTSILGTTDFVGAGTYPVSYFSTTTLYARYKSDKNAKTYAGSTSPCVSGGTPSVVSIGRNSTPRRIVPIVPTVVFDMDTFDYPTKLPEVKG